MSLNVDELKFDHREVKVKTINVDPVPQSVVDGLKKYQDEARGYGFWAFDKPLPGQTKEQTMIIAHRPKEEQLMQLYRIPLDTSSHEMERLTYFDIGTGRTISSFTTIEGEDWRGVWRAGGAIFGMDVDGREMMQLWRYWEDDLSETAFPKIDGELDNSPGKGRIERLTHDDFRYQTVSVTYSQKLMAYASNKENGTDFHVYLHKLKDSNTGAKPDSAPFTLEGKRITPLTEKGKGRWNTSGFSLDDKYLLLGQPFASNHRPMYFIDLSGDEPSAPELITLPGATEKEDEIMSFATFSRDPAQPHLLFISTSAYGDFRSIVVMDLHDRSSVRHITAPEPELHALKPIPWDVRDVEITPNAVWFTVNADGWFDFYVMPLVGKRKSQIIRVNLEWEGGDIWSVSNWRVGKPNEFIMTLASYRSSTRIVHVDFEPYLAKAEAEGLEEITVPITPYQQAQPVQPAYEVVRPKLIRFKSFDGLEIPCLYYHPANGKTQVPVVINIHGGPSIQAQPLFKPASHGYILNELGVAIIYPNVRGSSGYGKRYMAADDVLKREDSVKDIGALLDHISQALQNEIDPSKIAVMGGSYGGYMTFACLTQYSDKLACGVATCGVAHWPSFLKNTASHRQAHRRKEYGDETDPEVQKFLEEISPINHVSKITVPLLILHGENDTRIPLMEALTMWDNVRGRGVHAELFVGEKEGHSFKQKSVIEYGHAVRVQFLRKFLLGSPAN